MSSASQEKRSEHVIDWNSLALGIRYAMMTEESYLIGESADVDRVFGECVMHRTERVRLLPLSAAHLEKRVRSTIACAREDYERGALADLEQE